MSMTLGFISIKLVNGVENVMLDAADFGYMPMFPAGLSFFCESLKSLLILL